MFRTVAVGVRPSTPSRPFFTTNSLLVPSGFVIVTVWLPSGFSVVVAVAALPSLPSLMIVFVTLPSPSVTLTV